jgi:hypothetical protein
MPPVNWGAFEQLPGSVQYNFEMLCRALIRRHYERYGGFIARANQPGVEFHLKLHDSCALGDPGRWYGWQCRWYDLPGGRALGTVRRNKIQKAIATTEKELPDITDWVLWTRHPLTKSDQKWFYGLKTKMQLHLWTAAEVEEHLSGNAEILRGTYFGQLVLTPDSLINLHQLAVAPIRRRWQPEVHQTIDAERALRRMLAETKTWDDLRKLVGQLKAESAAIDSDVGDVPNFLADATTEMASLARTVANALADVHTALDRGDLDLLRQQLGNQPARPSQKLAELPRKLRASRHCAALTVTNTLADVRRARGLLDIVGAYIGKSIIAVTADAGCGKTQLAAQLTASVGDRPAGVLLHGRDLHAGNGLDDLSHHVVMQGDPVPSMEALVAAVDAAGQRAHRRIPIVIDGLNEAEDPRDWKAPLASLHETLRQYPYVFVVCMLRTAFTDEALPSDIDRLEIPDFGHDTVEAIRRYFVHYRINPADAELPIELLSHPLTLRLFCEVTNPTREREVGIEAMPGSLTSLFDRYLKQAAERIAELAPRTHRYYEQDVRRALDEIGTALWGQCTRGLDERDLRQRLGDEARLWNESIVRALEQDGIILRVPGETSGVILVTAIYDPLAGHLIADTILRSHGRTGFEKWVGDPSNMAALAGPLEGQHPLAMDVFRALVGLVPRRLHRQQLWSLLDEPLRTVALCEAAKLEGSYIDAQTVEELARLVTKPSDGSRDLLDRLWHTRGSPDHPLNAELLDAVLRPMVMADRDAHWTEWIRRNGDKLLADLQRLEKRWRSLTQRSPSDRLRARWAMWMLTSTVRQLRDQATRTLYWFGRGDPTAFFDLTLEALTINDPYVPERLIAASYGIAMALHNDEQFIIISLSKYARTLFEKVFAKNAASSTTHILARDYAKHTIDVALLHNKKLLNSRERMRITPPFKDGGVRVWGESEDRNKDEYRDGNYPFGFDFDNYTIGYLIPKRRNYDFDDPEYIKVKANMWWRIYDLGYSLEKFGEIDKRIAENSFRRHGRAANGGKTDRYGKKYCWIAYYEIAGFREDNGLLRRDWWESDRVRRFEVDIDPSFPEEPNNIEVIKTDFLGNRRTDLAVWIRTGRNPDLGPYLIVEKLQGEEGPWVLLDGYINQEDLDFNRGLFVFPRSLLVKNRDAEKVVNYLRKQDLGGRWVPEIPSTSYVFAGEIPWCETFHYSGETELTFTIGKKIEKVASNNIRFSKDGKGLDREEASRFLDMIKKRLKGDVTDKDMNDFIRDNKIEIIRPDFEERIIEKKKSYKVFIPVVSFSWESSHSMINPGQHAYIPPREFSEHLQLRPRPETFDFYDSSGRRASITLTWGEEWHTIQKLFFLRKDLLDKFLKYRKYELVWAIWGERQFKSRHNIGLQEFAKEHDSYRVFQEVLTYKEIMGKSLRKRG